MRDPEETVSPHDEDARRISDGLDDVCVVTQPLSTAGEPVTRSLLEILSAFTSVSLVTPHLPDDTDIRERYTVVELSDSGTGAGVVVPALRFVVNQLRMAREIVDRDEQIILFFGATSYLIPIVIAKVVGKTVVLEPRGDVSLTLRLYWEQRVPSSIALSLSRTVWLLERLGFWIADAIITYSPGVAEQLQLDRFEDKLHTSGARYVDTDVFYPRIPFNERSLAVGFLGRIDEEKGIRTLAGVAQRLPEDITFQFIGDGDLRPWLESSLDDEIRRGAVEVTGWVEHATVPEKLSELRLLVMPSSATEGIPTTILEAMACGTPVYATPVSGIPDVLADGETGFVMTSKETEDIIDEVVSVLQRQDLTEISERSRKVIAEQYSYDAAIERYRSIIESITVMGT